MTPQIKNVVLVHGAFADCSGWAPVARILKNNGYKVSVPQPPETSYADDQKYTKATIDAMGSPVVLVGHSYGGSIITAARARSALTELEGFPKGARVRFQPAGWVWRRACMARAYSLDLRERVVGAVAAGQSCRSVARTFMVSVASVVKWSQRQRVVGSPAALKMGGHRPYLVARERDWVLARIAEKPDLTLRALLKELADRGLVVSYYALWHFLQHEGVTFKKKPSRLRTGPPGRRQAA